MGFPRQECWSGLPFPSPGDLPDPGIDPRSVTSLLHWQVGSLLPGLPRSLAQKYPSRKPQPRPRLHLQLSQSGALCSAGNAPSGACPGVPATGLQSLGGPPPSWGTQQRLSVPPGTVGGDLAHLLSQGRFHDKTPSPPRAGTPRTLSVTTRQDDRCDVGQHCLLPFAHPPSLSPPVTEDCSQLPVHPPNLKISHQFKIVCYTFLKATGKEVFFPIMK